MIGALPPLTWNSYYSLQLSRKLAEEVDLKFISFKKLYPEFLYPAGKIKDKNISILDKEESFKIERTLIYYNPISWIKAGLSARGDITHIQWGIPIFSPIFFVIIAIAKLRGSKVVATVHNVLPHEGSILDKALCNLVFHFVDHFIVHSEQNIKELCTIFDIPESKASRIPLGAMELFKDEVISKVDSRKKLGIPLNSNVILFFGNIRDYKGLDILLESLPYVIEKIENTLLLIAGSPWSKWDKYDQMIQKKHLSAHVVLNLNFISSDLSKYYYYASDLVVLPYKEFMAQSEVGAVALSFEKPLIVTNVGGLSELVKDTRFVVEPNNPKALADKAVLALTNPDILLKLSMDSHDLAEKFSWGNIAKKTAGLYKNILGD